MRDSPFPAGHGKRGNLFQKGKGLPQNLFKAGGEGVDRPSVFEKKELEPGPLPFFP